MNYPYQEDTGLLYGKMGGVLFFHEYTRYTGEEIYNEYAYDLLMSVLNNLSKDIPVGFAQGFSGIGWGIQYLLSNRLLEADSEEIFEEIDRKIMEVDPLRMVDLSFDHGLAGIVFYITTRLICAGTDLSFRTQHASYLNQLNDGVERLAEEKVLTDIRKKFHTAYHGTHIIPEEIHIPDFFYGEELPVIKEYYLLPLGIKNGLTGVALKLTGL